MDYLAELKKEMMEEAGREFSEKADYYRSEYPGTDEEIIKTIFLLGVSGHTPSYKAIADYLKHNHRETLINAIRNNPKIFKYETIRVFIADILEGRDVRGKETYKRKETTEKEEKIISQLRFYRKLGYPLRYSPSNKGMNCFALTARKLDVDYVYVEEMYKRRDKNNSLLDAEQQIQIPKWIKDAFALYWGNILKLNGGVRPDNWEDLEALIEKMNDLSMSDVMALGNKTPPIPNEVGEQI